MTAKELKCDLLEYFLFRRNHLASFTESFWSSDVFSVTKNLYTIEVEIKVSKADLLSETRTIQWVLEKEYPVKIKLNKPSKHQTFLLDRASKYTPVPNRFYFAVTPDLASIAIEELDKAPFGYNQPNPYGVIVVDGIPTVVREAKKLHKNKVPQDALLRLMRKATTENFYLRQKLLSLPENPKLPNSNLD